jgi:hypothetical protein
MARNSTPFGLVALPAGVTAGVRPIKHLPIDRRDRDFELNRQTNEDRGSRYRMEAKRAFNDAPPRRPIATNGFWDEILRVIDSIKFRPGDLQDVSQPAVKCTDPQYCNIHGHPCACCGGSDKACPTGTVRGHYWSYCCNSKNIWFVDCCGGSVSCEKTKCPFCHNSSQPNWCLGFGGGRYVCTLAEDHGACP